MGWGGMEVGEFSWGGVRSEGGGRRPDAVRQSPTDRSRFARCPRSRSHRRRPSQSLAADSQSLQPGCAGCGAHHWRRPTPRPHLKALVACTRGHADARVAGFRRTAVPAPTRADPQCPRRATESASPSNVQYARNHRSRKRLVLPTPRLRGSAPTHASRGDIERPKTGSLEPGTPTAPEVREAWHRRALFHR